MTRRTLLRRALGVAVGLAMGAVAPAYGTIRDVLPWEGKKLKPWVEYTVWHGGHSSVFEDPRNWSGGIGFHVGTLVIPAGVGPSREAIVSRWSNNGEKA